ncbi:major facilitator superfamily domain-containing protein 4A [Gadus macrocephalus]|uniref:major facilitator superfamily domain-containing protein 4A n=1 Tax=Gadus macrocephalus TaxID=80720 RepID=UPI0028CB5301|nr:major facilitator superfamily domain-containing protein 4A [Gadus macrocephalus]
MVVDERIWRLFKRHWPQTVTYWCVCFSYGLCIAFLGPTVVDLQCQTRSTLEEITWVFFVQQVFMLVGMAFAGLFKRRLDLSLCALFWSTLLISVAFSLIPLCYNLSLLAIVMVIAGMAMGVVETITNLQLVKIYQKDSAIFLQFLHFFIGLGALVVPLMVDPFLSDGCFLGQNLTSNGTAAAPSPYHPYVILEQETAWRQNSSLQLPPTERAGASRSGLAFWVMALVNLPVPLVVFILMYKKRLLPCSRTGTHLLDRRETQEPESFSSKSPPEEQQQCPVGVFRCFNVSKLRDRPPFFFLLHVLAGAILFCTDGIIGAYTAFVFTYAETSPLKMSHHGASSLTSLFWASVTVGRLAFVYLSYRFPAVRLILLSLLGVVIVQSLLLIFYYSSVFLFVGTCLLGLCISSVFPCILAYTEELLDYKGCAATVLVTSAGTGEMVLQVIVGSGIQHRGSYAFPLSNIIVAILAFGIFIVLLFLHHLHIKSQKEPSKDVAATDIQRSGGP